MRIPPLSQEFERGLLERAVVPEHSVAFMRAMSGGPAFVAGEWLFLAADDWLMGVGYPFSGAEPAMPFAGALEEALAKTGAIECFAVAPELPERLRPFTENTDCFYTLEAAAAPPASLRGPLATASAQLEVREGREFTPAHRRLWAEFLERATLRPNVRGLYARTAAALACGRAALEAAGQERPPLDLRLLSAFDRQGNLAAALLLDYSPRDFCAYIIGAHSKIHYAPHATDLLFAAMLERCRAEGKRYVHLGLGVNEGITRFKKKWGGRSGLAFHMAAWKEKPRRARGFAGHGTGDQEGFAAQARGLGGLHALGGEAAGLARCLLEAPPDLSKQQIFATFPEQRRFGMIHEVRKGNALSYLCGSAHFFRYSFAMDFQELFAPLDAVVFEGPLDEDFLAAVEKSGRSPEPGEPRIADALGPEDMAALERAVYGREGWLPRLLGLQRPRRLNVRVLTRDARPWFAFFSIWVAYLERHGWRQSVDLEAWQTAKDMGVPVIAMENLEEQLASLESVPLPRIADFFRRCREWPAYTKRNIRTYLAGDLEGMMGSSIEFPSRTEQVIDKRDERFRRRMRPFIEAGNCAVFVGTAHLVGLIPMLEADGFSVRPLQRGMKATLRKVLGRLL